MEKMAHIKCTIITYQILLFTVEIPSFIPNFSKIPLLLCCSGYMQFSPTLHTFSPPPFFNSSSLACMWGYSCMRWRGEWLASLMDGLSMFTCKISILIRKRPLHVLYKQRERERRTQPVKTRRVSILIHLHITDANFPQRGLIGARLILTPDVDLQMLGCVWYGVLLPIFSKRQRVIWGIFYTALLLGHKYIAVHGI